MWVGMYNRQCHVITCRPPFTTPPGLSHPPRPNPRYLSNRILLLLTHPWMRLTHRLLTPFVRTTHLYTANKSSKHAMSLAPETPDRPTAGRSGQLTPGMVADELAKLELPAPTNLRLDLPATKQPLSPALDSALSGGSESGTGDISGPEPEAIVNARRKTRTESMSAELSATLAKMNLPQPERIFGPNEGESEAAREKGKGGKEGVSAEDWDKVVLRDEIPEAVKEPARMTHSRNSSRV
jgi:tryptophanyl-tRNA synthetase